MKDQVVTQELQEEYLYFYICFITNTQILLKLKYFKHKATEFHAFIWEYYILIEVNRS